MSNLSKSDAAEVNFYRILEVTPIASYEDINKSYRALSKKYHPDLCEDKALGEKKMKEIVAAFNQLKEKTSRDLYDNRKIFAFRPYNESRSGGEEKPKGFLAQLFKKKPDQKDIKKKKQLIENFGLAVSLAKTHKADSLKNAMETFRSVLQEQPRNPDAHYNLGLTHYFLGNFTDAAVCFQNAITLDENFNDAKTLLKSLEVD